MPNTLLNDKYKGKPFGEISKDIQSKYENRLDPISQRGLATEMAALRDQQELQKAKEQLKQNLQMAIAQEEAAMQNPQTQVPTQVFPSNQGVQVPTIQPQDNTAFNHAASQTYNQKFAYGGKMNYNDGGLMDLVNKARPDIVNAPLNFNGIDLKTSKQINLTQPGTNTNNQSLLNPLSYAPVLGNIFNLAASRKAAPAKETLQNMGYNTSIDPSLATKTLPRQTQFGKVDMSGIERAITRKGRGFTTSNANISGGNTGSFMANELANQSNIFDAVTNARMQQQLQDTQIEAMNAQEQGRIDAFKQQQAEMQAGIEAQNMNMGMNLLNIDDANKAARTNNIMANVAGLFENVGTIAQQGDMFKSIMKNTGYDMMGNYSQSGDRLTLFRKMLDNLTKGKQKKK